MDSTNLNSIHKLFKKGQDALKTSFFAFKFNPDHLAAVSYFTEAAHEYLKLKMYNESLLAFNEAIKCNNELNESWAQGQNYKEMAEIYINHTNDFNEGWKCLQSASLSFKISGKFTSGIKIYQDFAEKAVESKKLDQALKFLNTAFEDCLEHTHDELIRISLEEVFIKLTDLHCLMKKFEDAIIISEKYIQLQKQVKNEPKHKISKNYLKLGILRIIIDEVYIAEKIIDEMFSVYDSSCREDMEDLKKLINSFKELNKKDFNFLVVYAFSLYGNNMLKALRNAFDKKMQAQNGSNPPTNANRNEIYVDRIIQDDRSNISMNETNANTEINVGYVDEEIILSNNQNENTHAEDYL